MASRSPTEDHSSSSPDRRRRRTSAGRSEAGGAAAQAADVETAGAADETLDGEADIAAELSFREAQTALELCLAELQSPELDVEEMAGLYRRARRYADRCELLLQQVEQEVMQWDPEHPQDPPSPYQA